jgi:hypothetical protein
MRLIHRGPIKHGELAGLPKDAPYSPEYRAWVHMKHRCLCKTGRQYADYGGRGITVDPAWMNFATFLADVGRKPSRKHSLDRRDNDKGYDKANCRWALPHEQQNNRRKRRYFRKP